MTTGESGDRAGVETRDSRLENSEPISRRKAVTQGNEGAAFRGPGSGHISENKHGCCARAAFSQMSHFCSTLTPTSSSHHASHSHHSTDHAPPLIPLLPSCPPRRTPRRSHTRARPCAAPATAAAFKQWHLHPSQISLPPIACRLLVHSSLPRPPVPTPPWPRAV